MRYISTLIIVLFIFTNCEAQEKELLIRKSLISDLSICPMYPHWRDTIDGKSVWKKKFEYLDSIDIYSITYLSDGLKINGYMAKPKAKGAYPCVIYNRGGNREFGSMVVATAALRLGDIAKEGYVVIASQYRGNSGSEGKEEFGGKDVNDVTILTEVLEEVEGADTDKIGMYGWSRGGMMTFLALAQTDKIKVVAVGGASTDLTIMDRPMMETKVYAELIPDYWENKTTELEKRSVVKWVDKLPKDVPILMVHGTSDWRVKPAECLNFAQEFQKYQLPYRLIMYEGGDHGIREHKSEVNKEIIAWFDKYLKNGVPLPNTEYHGR